MMGDTRKGGVSLSADLAWCEKHIRSGENVCCIRDRVSGLVVTYVAGEPERWISFDGRPMSDFTLTPMLLVNGRVMFGKERLITNG